MLSVLAVLVAAAEPPRSILFVGNSFTFGANSPVMTWHSKRVTDLNHEGMGGVPALFEAFSDQLHLGWCVSLETAAGQTLKWHWENRRRLLDRKWDAVVLQDYSTMDPDRPGNPTELIAYSGRFATLFRKRSPQVAISMTATWSRPNLTYPVGEHWSGQPITRMAMDVRHGYELARAAHPSIRRINPVGEAFNCAIRRGIADPNPYDGLLPGQIDLWAGDHYHASTAGYYLEALVVFAGVTGADARRLGAAEKAAGELGINADLAAQLQKIAQDMTHGGGC
jgi:hypothetical protein